jgi:hypothetical protein
MSSESGNVKCSEARDVSPRVAIFVLQLNRVYPCTASFVPVNAFCSLVPREAAASQSGAKPTGHKNTEETTATNNAQAG